MKFLLIYVLIGVIVYLILVATKIITIGWLKNNNNFSEDTWNSDGRSIITVIGATIFSILLWPLMVISYLCIAFSGMIVLRYSKNDDTIVKFLNFLKD